MTASEAIDAARSGSALSDRTVLIEAATLEGGERGDPRGRIEKITQRPGLVRLRIEVDRPTWLVAREPFYRNWRATIDGHRASIHPAGGFFLAVLVEAGLHEVTLTYHEPGLRAGAAVAFLVAILLPVLMRRAVRTPIRQ